MEDSSGWELQKENIQPLSSGRNISLLKTSTDMAQQEGEVQATLKELEHHLHTYEGEDPLQPHLNLIRFLEHQSVHIISWRKTLATARMECYKRFYDSPKYQNDKRYVDAIIKCLNEAVPDPSTRFNLLQTSMTKKGIGKVVANMHLSIADILESMGRGSEAVKAIRTGIQEGAEPKEKLEEALSELEFRIARELAKSMKEQQEQLGDAKRNFGASVPVYGEKNDAPVFRNDLQPAQAVVGVSRGGGGGMTRQKSDKQVNLYQEKGNNEHGYAPSSKHHRNPSYEEPPPGFSTVERALDSKTMEKENNLAPSKWNKPDMVVVPETDSESSSRPQRIPIFVEEEEEPDLNKNKNRPLPPPPQGVLKERKVEIEVIQPPTSILDEDTVPVKDKDPSDSKNPFPPLPGSLCTSNSIKIDSGVPDAKLICTLPVLRSTGKLGTFEHRYADLWLRKKQEKDQVSSLLKDKAQLDLKVFKLDKEIQQLRETEESLRENFELELRHKLKKEGEWERQKYLMNETILKLTREVGELKDENNQFKQTNEDNARRIQFLHEDYEGKLTEVMKQLELALQRNNSSNLQQPSGGGSSSNSNSNTTDECTAIRKEGNSSISNSSKLQVSSSSRSTRIINTINNQSIALASDKLMNMTGFGGMGMESFSVSGMAPPSRIQMSMTQEGDDEGDFRMNMDESVSITSAPIKKMKRNVPPTFTVDEDEGEDYSKTTPPNEGEPSPSFNASVRMGGATTMYDWKTNDKTRFCQVEENDSPLLSSFKRERDTTGNETAPEPPQPETSASTSLGFRLPPPRRTIAKKFSLYESVTEQPPPQAQPHPHQRREVAVKDKENCSNNKVDFRTLSENVPPPPSLPPQFGGGAENVYNSPPQAVARIPASLPITPRGLVSDRIAEIEKRATGVLQTRDEFASPLRIGKTFNRPHPSRAVSSENILLRKDYEDEEEEMMMVPPMNANRSQTNYHQPPTLPFDTSNLTCALQFAPPPLLNSTPQRSTFGGGGGGDYYENNGGRNRMDLYSGNYVHTQRLPRMSEVLRAIDRPQPPPPPPPTNTTNSGVPDGPLSPQNEALRQSDYEEWRRQRAQGQEGGGQGQIPNYNNTMNLQMNLSPIQETSKENRSHCTTGSSSSNMTRGGGISMFGSNSRSVSGPGGLGLGGIGGIGIRSGSTTSTSSSSSGGSSVSSGRSIPRYLGGGANGTGNYNNQNQ